MNRICWEHYHTPESVGDALDLLGRYDGRARVIGGGTDLLLEIQQGREPPVEAMVFRGPGIRGSTRSTSRSPSLLRAAEATRW